MLQAFVARWGPFTKRDNVDFLVDLRALLKAYAGDALKHQSLPDDEHEHGEPV